MLIKGEKEYETDVKGIAEEVLYDLRKRNGYNSDATPQQSAAASASGARYEALSNLIAPAFIIHGTTAPLMPFAHGKKTAEVIPNAEILWVQGMGHDVPEIFAYTILNRIFDFWEIENQPY